MGSWHANAAGGLIQTACGNAGSCGIDRTKRSVWGAVGALIQFLTIAWALVFTSAAEDELFRAHPSWSEAHGSIIDFLIDAEAARVGLKRLDTTLRPPPPAD